MMSSESAFLSDGRQWAWNHSSLEPAKLCPRKYYYSVIEGWRLKSASNDLIFGLHYAKALELYHKLRALQQEHKSALYNVVSTTLTAIKDWKSAHNAKTPENLIRSIVWYLDQYENDPCRTVVLSNGKPAVEITFRFQLDNDIMMFGHLDRIVEYGGDYYVQDQKTTGATLGFYYFDRYNPHDQMSLYTLAGAIVYKQPIAGVMIDAAQIAVNFTRFERGFTYRTKDQTIAWLADARYWINRTWEAAARGYPMNDAACMMYGGCPFRQVCSKAAGVRPQYLETYYVQDKRDPLAERA